MCILDVFFLLVGRKTNYGSKMKKKKEMKKVVALKQKTNFQDQFSQGTKI